MPSSKRTFARTAQCWRLKIDILLTATRRNSKSHCTLGWPARTNQMRLGRLATRKFNNKLALAGWGRKMGLGRRGQLRSSVLCLGFSVQSFKDLSWRTRSLGRSKFEDCSSAFTTAWGGSHYLDRCSLHKSSGYIRACFSSPTDEQSLQLLTHHFGLAWSRSQFQRPCYAISCRLWVPWNGCSKMLNNLPQILAVDQLYSKEYW